MWDPHHLRKANSHYLRHFVFAMWFNVLALALLITGIVHAFLPWLFPFTPYRLAKKIVQATEKYFINHADRK